MGLAELLDIGRDVDGLDHGEASQPVSLAPGEEVTDRPAISLAGVGVADMGGEEFQEPSRGRLSLLGDDRRQRQSLPQGDRQSDLPRV